MASFAKSRVPRFSAEVYQNPYLPEGGREVHTIVTVTATGGGTTGGRPVSVDGRPVSVDGRPDTGVKEIADVGLRLWTPQGAEVVFLKQVAPTVEDLTGGRRESGARSGDYPTGSWGDEARDYHLFLRVPAAGIGARMLAGRVSLIIPTPVGDPARPSSRSGPTMLSQGLVRAFWTDDLTVSTSIDPQVAHYTGQAELAQAIQQGLDARKSGDVDRATAKLGRAVQLAGASGNTGTAKLLAKVVDVLNAANGTVRLKAKVAEADEMTLETR
ncbi:hypothetical protein AB0C96_06170 [Streptomyces sp. NPDC048506]|uniref:hypothetical protein n=1 Tax=Streptomyces sp. NPDC048506 TaxID=3155028 RepID=UPI00343DF467